jgi:hypothetical protein
MPIQPAPDIRAERTYLQTAGSRIVEGEPRDRTADSLTFIVLAHHGVKEDDGVGSELVLGDAHEHSVDPRLVTALHRVVEDCHAHVAHCARGARTLASVKGWRSGVYEMGMTSS